MILSGLNATKNFKIVSLGKCFEYDTPPFDITLTIFVHIFLKRLNHSIIFLLEVSPDYENQFHFKASIAFNILEYLSTALRHVFTYTEVYTRHTYTNFLVQISCLIGKFQNGLRWLPRQKSVVILQPEPT